MTRVGAVAFSGANVAANFSRAPGAPGSARNRIVRAPPGSSEKNASSGRKGESIAIAWGEGARAEGHGDRVAVAARFGDETDVDARAREAERQVVGAREDRAALCRRPDEVRGDDVVAGAGRSGTRRTRRRSD